MNDDNSTAEAQGSDPAQSAPVSTWARLKALFASEPDASLRDSLQDVIEQHDNNGNSTGIRPQERSMILNLLEFSELRVDDVMVPRADIIAVEDTIPIGTLLAIFVEANHSRIPVFHDTLDDPLGMVHIKDLVRWMTERPKARRNGTAKPRTNGNGGSQDNAAINISAKSLATPIGQAGLIREALFVPPSMRAGDLLVRMQTSRIHMAIVVDEYGGTDGLATIEDLVEEIVGDISDEHDDADADLIRQVSAGVFTADARAPIETVEELLGIDLLPDELDEDADTLGGMVFTLLGRVPVRGELIKHDSGVEFEISSADLRRIKRLKIHLPSQAIQPQQDAGEASGE